MPEGSKKIDTIDSLFKIIEILKKEYSNKELYFRGQKRHYNSVVPSIARENFLKNEDILFKEFILRNPDEFSDKKTTFEKLAMMQHYKLPTRLLDITTNPLVALYFATEFPEGKNSDEDGEFIVFAIPKEYVKYYDSDTVSVVSNIARRPIDKLNISNFRVGLEILESDKERISRFNELIDIVYLHHEIKDEKPYFKPIIEKQHLESIWCVKPLLNNRRIIKQDGAFLLFGIDGSKDKLAKFRKEIFEPIIFQVGNKQGLRNQLGLLGVTQDKIFPELDTTAEYLREIYK